MWIDRQKIWSDDKVRAPYMYTGSDHGLTILDPSELLLYDVKFCFGWRHTTPQMWDNFGRGIACSLSVTFHHLN